MRKYFICIGVALIGSIVLAASAAELRDQVYTRLQAASEKQLEQKTKTYTGDFESILAARIADVNEVIVDIGTARQAATDLAALNGDPNAVKEAVQQVICKKTKEQKQIRKIGALGFMQAVEQILNDPNNQPDPNDLLEQERLADLRRACLEITESELRACE